MPGIPDDSIPTSFDPSPLDNGVPDLHLPSSISTFNLDRYTNKKKKNRVRETRLRAQPCVQKRKRKRRKEGREIRNRRIGGRASVFH